MKIVIVNCAAFAVGDDGVAGDWPVPGRSSIRGLIKAIAATGRARGQTGVIFVLACAGRVIRGSVPAGLVMG